VAEAYRTLATAGLVVGAQGNVALVDRSMGVVYVTGTGLAAATASADDVAEVDLGTGAHLRGPAPSTELATHLAVLNAGRAAVVHTHAPHATALALVEDEIPAVLAEQVIRVGGPVPVIPYVPTGSQEMAAAVAAMIGASSRAVVIRNHGVFAAGSDLGQALGAMLATEEAARAYLLARSIGVPAQLDQPSLAHLRTLGG
jgi:L-fuculose-phosphate aldolase